MNAAPGTRHGHSTPEDDNEGDEREGMATISDGDLTRLLPGAPAVSVEELARRQGVRPVRSFDDMRADLWTSDEEFDEFLADVHASRQADVG